MEQVEAEEYEGCWQSQAEGTWGAGGVYGTGEA